ncbi:MAG: hypothetical protein LBB25_02935, partial [Holosporaceae bacterium]|nr:hypothetical protein [Holosporaceae bacterium]
SSIKGGYLKKETRVIVGRSLDKALETVLAFKKYVEKGFRARVPLPDDPFEIADDNDVLAAELVLEDKMDVVRKTEKKVIVSIDSQEDEKF